jgi:hypothetical protein
MRKYLTGRMIAKEKRITFTISPVNSRAVRKSDGFLLFLMDGMKESSFMGGTKNRDKRIKL